GAELAACGGCWCSFVACLRRCVCFFFQAEDGIRDLIVTGVQTCALPISLSCEQRLDHAARRGVVVHEQDSAFHVGGFGAWCLCEIGRASCRERVEITVVEVSVKRKEIRVWRLECAYATRQMSFSTCS